MQLGAGPSGGGAGAAGRKPRPLRAPPAEGQPQGGRAPREPTALALGLVALAGRAGSVLTPPSLSAAADPTPLPAGEAPRRTRAMRSARAPVAARGATSSRRVLSAFLRWPRAPTSADTEVSNALSDPPSKLDAASARTNPRFHGCFRDTDHRPRSHPRPAHPPARTPPPARARQSDGQLQVAWRRGAQGSSDAGCGPRATDLVPRTARRRGPWRLRGGEA